MDEQIKTPFSWFDFTIRRGPIVGPMRKTVGLILHVRADASIEEFIKAHSRGIVHPVNEFDSYWVSLDSDELTVYEMSEDVIKNNGSNSTIMRPGSPIYMGPEVRGGPYTNMSFLRLVGISKPEGVRIGILGAYSKTVIAEVSRAITRDVRDLILNYITPLEVNLKIVSQS